jgi:hypothetical protein
MDSGDRRLTGTYLRVLLVEAAILLALWLVGRVFS